MFTFLAFQTPFSSLCAISKSSPALNGAVGSSSLIFFLSFAIFYTRNSILVISSVAPASMPLKYKR